MKIGDMEPLKRAQQLAETIQNVCRDFQNIETVVRSQEMSQLTDLILTILQHSTHFSNTNNFP